jgi:hypothetical protein
MATTIDPFTETLAADIDAAKQQLDALHDRLYAEPTPRPHAVARCVVALPELRGSIEALNELLDGTP